MTVPRRTLRALLAIAILAALAWYVWHARRQLAMVLHLDPRYLLPMIAVPLGNLLVNGRIGRDLAAEFGVRLSFTEWYGLAVMNSLGNYLPLPQAGAVARGLYLTRFHDLPYTTYAATLVVTYVSAIALYGVLGILGLIVLRTMGRPSPPILWAAFLLLAASMLLFTPLARLLPIPARFAHLGDHLATLRRHHLIARIVLLQALLVALTTTGMWLACKTLPQGQGVSWLTALMLGLMTLASGIINVTPGNVGVEQGAAELAARLLHVPPDVGFLASALFRAVAVVTIFTLAPFFSAALARVEPRRHGDSEERNAVRKGKLADQKLTD